VHVHLPRDRPGQEHGKNEEENHWRPFRKVRFEIPHTASPGRRAATVVARYDTFCVSY
jgi:hypothetical protein